MALTVNSNIASLNAQRNLGASTSNLSTSLERLASGSKINSAKDDAAGLQISNRLTSQINGLNVAVKNANDGVSIAQTAEGAMQESTNIMQRMRDLALQAANGSNSDSERAALQQEFSALSGELTRIAETTAFGGKKLLDGSMGNTSFQIGSNANETVSFGLSSVSASALSGTFSSAKVAGDVSTLSASVTGAANKFAPSTATGASVSSAGASVEGTAIAANAPIFGGAGEDKLTSTAATEGLVINGTAINLAEGDSRQGVVDKINAQSGTTGVTASFADNKITLSSANTFVVDQGANTAALGLATNATTDGGAASAFTLNTVTTGSTLALNVGGTVTTIEINPTAGGTGRLEGAGGVIDQINKQSASTGVTASVDAATGGLKLQGTSAFTIETANTELGLVADATPQTNITGTENLRDAAIATGSTAIGDLIIGSTAITLAEGDTLADVADKINAETGTTGVTATVNDQGGLSLSSTVDFKITDNAVSQALNLIDANATTLGLIEAGAASNGGAAKDGSFKLNDVTISFNKGDDIAAVMKSINDQTANTGVTASEKDGRLVLSSENGDGKSIKLADDVAGSLSTVGLTAGSTAAKLQESTSINLNGTEVKLAAGSDMEAVATAINTASTGVSASVNANGGLDLFSGNESFTLTDGASGTGLAALGLTDAAGTHTGVVVEASVSNLDITSAEGAQQAISVLDGAMQQIDSERAKLGAVQNRFESTISNLQNIAENASAARGRVMDTDYAAESANLAKNQIMQQAGTAMLAQANQLPQAVLSLLG
ncbi:flagellin N-terminal helical domain-containing protein [Halopseudomonas xiamenensis]|uniref:flagellin N-terminal helical domain-containing protein n=1 Tax=Halopseudomonas xiamenensis TaxID=157792 RepID=UPI0016274198|nr:flagellin hook IN motif-containing protein [Halopseudomonas xiamenensis]